jgi:hypothetical protein
VEQKRLQIRGRPPESWSSRRRGRSRSLPCLSAANPLNVSSHCMQPRLASETPSSSSSSRYVIRDIPMHCLMASSAHSWHQRAIGQRPINAAPRAVPGANFSNTFLPSRRRKIQNTIMQRRRLDPEDMVSSLRRQLAVSPGARIHAAHPRWGVSWLRIEVPVVDADGNLSPEVELCSSFTGSWFYRGPRIASSFHTWTAQAATGCRVAKVVGRWIPRGTLKRRYESYSASR